MTIVRTRFAPSPTGYMHIGNLRTALYAYFFARKNDGKFILRIEDTDRERYIPDAVDLIYRVLKETGVCWDEGPDVGGEYAPYVQSERKATYAPYAEKLIEQGHAYRCFCSKEDIDKRREEAASRGETFKYDKKCLHLSHDEIEEKLSSGIPYVVRQNVPTEGKTSFRDEIYGDITVDNSTLDDHVLIKADGMPTYNFANVIDDHLMEITHILRGVEFLSSTPKYCLLYEALGWNPPKFIHLPPVMRDERHKLSKRDGDASYEDFINRGYLSEAIVNYISLLGWSPGDEREKFTLDELCEAFSLEGLNKSPAVFDPMKLRWLNALYVRELDANGFDKYALPRYEEAGVLHMDRDILREILQPRVEIFSEIPDMLDFLTRFDSDYSLDFYTNKKSKTNPEVAFNILNSVIPKLEALSEDDWKRDTLHDLLLGMAADLGVKNGTLLWPVRIAMAGKLVTPGGAIEIACLLGRDETLRRLKTGQKRLMDAK